MKAVILAGGKGTRLGSLAGEIPKPMIKIGNKPVLEHQIELLKHYGITEIIILACHLHEVIEQYFGDGKKYGVSLKYFIEESPLGTAGCIKEIESFLTTDFLVLYGDIMINMDLKRLADFHKSNKAVCTLVLHPNEHPYDSDLVEISPENKVTAFHSKPHKEDFVYRNLVNASLYVMSPAVLKYIKKGIKSDFGKDIFPEMIKHENVSGYVTPEYLKDMGTPDRLNKAREDYASGKIQRLSLENKRKAIFLDRDGVINKLAGHVSKPEDFELLPCAIEAIKQINQSEYLAIVVTNQPVVARNECTIEQLENIHKKMETLLGHQGTMVNAIYYCPHHPDKGYPGENLKFKIDCNCRKPKTGMIDKAVKEFNISLAGSFLIGDSVRDLDCARNAGITPIGIRTGEGCKDCKTAPDYFFENLSQAVSFIIDKWHDKECTDIMQRIAASKKKPYVLSIAGNSRSGKTTIANLISGRLQNAGKKTLYISLDNWLLPKELRKPEHDVFGRFQLGKINKDISQLLSGEDIILPKYSALSQKSTDSQISYKLSGHDVIIIDGIVSLGTESLRQLADLKVFCESDTKTQKKRLAEFYSWKGLSAEEIKSLIEKRKSDEYDLISEHRAYADITITQKTEAN